MDIDDTYPFASERQSLEKAMCHVEDARANWRSDPAKAYTEIRAMVSACEAAISEAKAKHPEIERRILEFDAARKAEVDAAGAERKRQDSVSEERANRHLRKS